MVTLQILATLDILSFPQLEHSNVRSRKKEVNIMSNVETFYKLHIWLKEKEKSQQ